MLSQSVPLTNGFINTYAIRRRIIGSSVIIKIFNKIIYQPSSILHTSHLFRSLVRLPTKPNTTPDTIKTIP